MVVLDDVLSALDSSTQSHIAENLLGPNGLFRNLHTTVVVVSHSSKKMRTILPTRDLANHAPQFNSTTWQTML